MTQADLADGAGISRITLAEYKNAILEAMVRGTKRYVESEDAPSKNAPAEQATKSALPG